MEGSTPYFFMVTCLRVTAEPLNKKLMGGRLVQASAAIKNLSGLGWSWVDTCFIMHQMADSLRKAGICPTYSLMCSIFKRTKDRVVVDKTTRHKDWIQQEVERLNAKPN